MGPVVTTVGPNLVGDSKCGTAAPPKTVRFSYNLHDSLYIGYGCISPINHDQKQLINTDHDHDS
jgi:hypothetical protein